MKSLTKLSLAAATASVLPVFVQAAPLVSFGDNVDLYFNGEATARYETNVLLAPDALGKDEDTVFVFSPGLELVSGLAGQTALSANVIYRHHFLTYVDNDELDTDNADLDATVQFNGSRFTFTGDLSYLETQQNTITGIGSAGLTPGRVDRSIFAWSGYGEYEATSKVSVGAGLQTSNTDYKTLGYRDTFSASVPVDVYYAITPKVDLSVGYRYRETDVEGSWDYDDHFFNVGARGELAPKLTGNVRVGLQTREFQAPGLDNEDFVALSAGLSYALSPLAQISLNLDRDYVVNPINGNTIERTGGTIGGSYAFSQVLTGNAYFGYFYSEYPQDSDREDDFYNVGLSLSYTPNEYVRLTGGVVHYKNDSSLVSNDFDNTLIEFSAALRY